MERILSTASGVHLTPTTGMERPAAKDRLYGDAEFIFCHCEEGHGPDVAIRVSVRGETDSHCPSGTSE